jgi:hypothetical protein
MYEEVNTERLRSRRHLLNLALDTTRNLLFYRLQAHAPNEKRVTLGRYNLLCYSRNHQRSSVILRGE